MSGSPGNRTPIRRVKAGSSAIELATPPERYPDAAEEWAAEIRAKHSWPVVILIALFRDLREMWQERRS